MPATPDIDTTDRLTAEGFMAIADRLDRTPGKTELVDGRVIHGEPSEYIPFAMRRQLFLKLDAIFGDGLDGHIVGQGLTVLMNDWTVRDPDIAIFRDPGMIPSIVGRDVLLLAAEVSDSSLRDDLGAKRLSYATAGVPDYWVIDVNARRIHRFTGPIDGDYAAEDVVPFGTPIAVPGTDRTITLD